jgi:hypothetical protein
MSDADRDPKVTERYRALGAEEPPRALDEAILAAARSEVEARPAPLVAPTGRRRWYVPLAAAAVILLSVAVSFHMQLEEPGTDGVPPGERKAEAQPQAGPPPVARAPQEVAREQPVPKAAVAMAEKRAAEAQRVPRRLARDSAPRAEAERAPAPVELPAKEEEVAAAAARAPAEPPGAAAVAVPSAPAAPAMQRDELSRDRTDRVAAQQMRSRVALAPETPEKALERIAELRRAGRHEEADKALAEFRKRHPDYKIPEAMLERLERR